MPKHDKPILDVSAIRINKDHFRNWETRFHDYCLLEGYRNPAKDRLTQTTDHYIEAKRPFELAVLRSTIPSSEWNTLDDVITSKIPLLTPCYAPCEEDKMSMMNTPFYCLRKTRA